MGDGTAPDIALEMILRIDLILDTHSTEHTWQAFSSMLSDNSA